jgi:2-keto-4-pentenoate hydratase
MRLLHSLCFLTSISAIPGWAQVTDSALESFAEKQTVAFKGDRGLPQLSVAFPEASTADAEWVQKRFISRRLLSGETLAGIKGAVVGAKGQTSLGIDGPLSAVLLRGGWHEAKDIPVRIPVREGATPGVETELGLLLSKPVRNAIPDIVTLKDHVSAIVPVIELPAGRHDWPQKPAAVDLIAANVGADHFILGQRHEDLDLDLDALPIRLSKDGDIVHATTGGDAKRGQWWNFLHQVNWAVEQGYRPQPGHLVITGALGKIHKADRGAFHADFGELGSIEFELVAE